MRKFKVLSLLVCCLATTFMSSCLGDDDGNSGLSPEQVGQCLNAIKGRYTGEMVYASTNPDNAKDNTDTLQIAWTVMATDTTLTIYNFQEPTRLLLLSHEISSMDGKIKSRNFFIL